MYIIVIIMISFSFHQGCQGVNGVREGMKIYNVEFSRLRYYKSVQMAHLFWSNAYWEECNKNITENI